MTHEPTAHARTAARHILTIVPLVMRTVAAELRAAGELPAPAHFGLLSLLASRPRPLTLTELAALQGVSLPTMSNTVKAMVDRGWVHRATPAADRRVVVLEVTGKGRATVQRVGRSAEAHLAQRLTHLDATSRQRLEDGLGVLLRVFAAAAGGRARGRAAGLRKRRARAA